MPYDSYSLDLGGEPYDEPCLAPVNPDNPNYLSQQRVIANAYILALKRVFGEPPQGARLRVVSNPHDFGAYLSVVCNYRHCDDSDDSDDDSSVDDSINPEDYAYKCESGVAKWSDAGLEVKLVDDKIVVIDLRDTEPSFNHTVPPCGAD